MHELKISNHKSPIVTYIGVSWNTGDLICVFLPTAEQEQCPLEGPKTTSQPYQVNKTRDKFVGDGEGRRTGVIVGTVVGCTAVVALIVIITILVSKFLSAFDVLYDRDLHA